ncbi:hypothetical protein TEQG_08834 [Trichophyton equinum CBS 127.97]|uniref:Uncharacterized protein n=1 Tax=Trichophyton equinum (strain ATCC MYA-4606 / CBS 127.97) TaxID=559882 RepID=F2Q4V2_TRIEC|nr:hypothetical protein TEQG_08834 [Trichophyton equinum CBS 127.97]
MQRMHERRSATADGFDAGQKGTARRGRQTDGSPPLPLTPGNPEDRGREMLLSSLSCVYLASRMSPPAPPALLVRALTILWRPWEKGVLPVPVPIDFEPETTAQQRSPSSYASTSKASDASQTQPSITIDSDSDEGDHGRCEMHAVFIYLWRPGWLAEEGYLRTEVKCIHYYGVRDGDV